MVELSSYMAKAKDQTLPPEVAQAGKQRILDALAAMVSGSRLKPGEMATRYVRALGGTSGSCLIASNIVTTAINAALGNGMLAHADETGHN